MDLSNKGFAQAGAVVVGAAYLIGGLVGFFATGFDGFVQNGNDTLLTLELNPFHNIFHIFAGAFLIIIAQFGRPATEGALIGGGAVYLVALFLGVTGNLSILSMEGGITSDNVLHLITGTAALGLGLLSVARNAEADRLGSPLEQR
jgi:hypothetical protein